MDCTEDTSISVALLIPLDKEHKTNGAFRLVVFGGNGESVPILAEDLFKDLPSRLRLPDNSTACPWSDVELLIRNGHITIT